MIRIPFNGDDRTAELPARAQGTTTTAEPTGRLRELDARVRLLESKLATHAEDLKAAVTDRIERIESRIERAVISLTRGTEQVEDGAGNVVEFTAEESTSHHLPTAAALEALDDLNDTLEGTREHLEALNASVARMKRAVGELRE